MQQHNIVIVGGGPIGLTTALNLAKAGQKVTVLDPLVSKRDDGRVLALSYASYAYLDELGVWPHQIATPIKQVHISHSGFGISHINASDVNLECLGYTIKYADLCAQLLAKISSYPQIKLVSAVVREVMPQYKQLTVNDYITNTTIDILAKLIVIAEGGSMSIPGIKYTKYDYNQMALIAGIKVSNKTYQQVAFERFDDKGAMVLLPYGDNYVLVWSVKSNIAADILKNNSLIDELASSQFMQRFGSFELLGKIHSFSLILQLAKSRVQNNLVLIGNSAQIVHPVSAQGLNLGLRDVQMLSDLLIVSNFDIEYSLQQYDKLRNYDTKFVSKFTHFLAKFVEQQSPLLKHIRGIGIVGISNCKVLQNKIANSLIFGV